ncbi:sushi, nidogen and EGF-like domain-containing protein 1 [Saccostrea echinata]|uniref:sushi, nidogen and EGF-like domain-containing protein 1 n=1 Tax=Saccostrea echinata TaxID=191078 RepID=UPI002A820ED8|nr:sushi, nidogen and EGF-like domain-containing protein 1 [Saccostrea echinata]
MLATLGLLVFCVVALCPLEALETNDDITALDQTAQGSPSLNAKIRIARFSFRKPRPTVTSMTCEPSRCQNGGTCIYGASSCRCPEGYTGVLCETGMS